MNIKIKPTPVLVAIISTYGLGYSLPAKAEMIDHGSLEALFGEPITTSASGTPQRASEVAANMTIITADEIRQSGSRSIPDIVSRVPGLDVLQTGLDGYDVGVRGYQQPSQPRLLVLVDGRQVFIDDYSRTIWNNIPVNIDDIRQIEVVKGASSALFGSNAAGGVINIVTYSPIYDNNNVATLGAGTQNEFTGDATTTQKGNWGGTKFSAGGLHATEFSTPRDPSNDQVPTTNPQHTYVTNQTVFKLAPTLQANFEGTYSQSNANLADGVSYIMEALKATTYSARAGLDWQSPIGLISSKNYFNHSEIGLSEATSPQPFQIQTGLFVSQLQDEFKANTDNSFRAQLEYRHKDFSNSAAAIIPQSPSLSEDNYAASGTWLWQINDQWSWTNAARIDHEEMAQTGILAPGLAVGLDQFSHDNNAWSGNSDLVYKPTNLDTFRVGYGRGVQMPSLIQSAFNEILYFSGVPIDAEGNPSLKPTIVEDYSIDYTRKIDPIFSSIKFSTYYEENKDIVSGLDILGVQTILGNPYVEAMSQNVGNSHGWGGEIELKGGKSGFRWDASYSYAQVVDSAGVATNLDYQGSTPVHHFRLLGGYSTGSWEFDANSQFVTSTDMLRSRDGGLTDYPTYNQGYFSLAGRIGYTVAQHFTVALSGTNIQNHNVTASPYPAIQRQALLTLTGKF